MLITCTECGKKLKFADTMAGKKVRCPHCKATVRAPNEVDEVASAPKPNAIPSTAKKESAAWDKGEFSDDEPAPKKKSVAKKKRPADDNEDEDEDAPADAMRCAKCESARIEALPPNRFSRHPGFLCKKCGARMRPPNSTGFYVFAVLLGVFGILAGLSVLGFAILCTSAWASCSVI